MNEAVRSLIEPVEICARCDLDRLDLRFGLGEPPCDVSAGVVLEALAVEELDGLIQSDETFELLHVDQGWRDLIDESVQFLLQ